jgi:hypothetical protein
MISLSRFSLRLIQLRRIREGGGRGNPLWLPLRAGTGACPYNLNPLPPMDGEEVIGDLPVQCHVWVI